MIEKTDVLVAGGGPGGLACATFLARSGVKVMLVERKATLGAKVCAGGITWHGLLKHVPDHLIERAFPQQHIVTTRQRIEIAESNPIIATVNRQRLGQWMAEQAGNAGVTIRTGTRVRALEPYQATLEAEGGRSFRCRYSHLVGADGANSQVRRFLGLPSDAMGVGLNCMHPGVHPRMEWHLLPRLFGPGYGWLFPHATCCSVGAYVDVRQPLARTLKPRLVRWAEGLGFRLDPATIRAGLVNFDYRGVRFDRTWLVGDAAGLASGLTGEGIYPALVSGQTVARMILDPDFPGRELAALVRKQRQHRRLVTLAGRNPRLCGVMMEAMVMLLRIKVIDFHSLEMAD